MLAPFIAAAVYCSCEVTVGGGRWAWNCSRCQVLHSSDGRIRLRLPVASDVAGGVRGVPGRRDPALGPDPSSRIGKEDADGWISGHGKRRGQTGAAATWRSPMRPVTGFSVRSASDRSRSTEPASGTGLRPRSVAAASRQMRFACSPVGLLIGAEPPVARAVSLRRERRIRQRGGEGPASSARAFCGRMSSCAASPVTASCIRWLASDVETEVHPRPRSRSR